MANKSEKRTKYFMRDKFSIYEAAMLWIGEEPCDEYGPAEKVYSIKSFEYYEVAREILRAIKDGEIHPDAVDPEEALRPGNEVEREDAYGRTLRPLKYEETDYFRYTDIAPSDNNQHIDTETIKFGFVAKEMKKWDAIRNYDLSVYHTTVKREALAAWANTRDEQPDFLYKDIQSLRVETLNCHPQKVIDLNPQTNIFKNDDGAWRIIFQGHALQSLQDTKGLRYIHFLIKNQGKPFYSYELETEFYKYGQRRESYTSLKTVDPQIIKECKRRLDDIESELAIAIKGCAKRKIDKLREEEEFIKKVLKGSIGLFGRNRKLDDCLEKSRLAVTIAISRAISKIGKKSPPLWQHFKNDSIRTGYVCIYVPRDPITWQY